MRLTIPALMTLATLSGCSANRGGFMEPEPQPENRGSPVYSIGIDSGLRWEAPSEIVYKALSGNDSYIRAVRVADNADRALEGPRQTHTGSARFASRRMAARSISASVQRSITPNRTLLRYN